MKDTIDLDDSDLLFNFVKMNVALENIFPQKKFRLLSLKDTHDPRESDFKINGSVGFGYNIPENFIEISAKANTAIDKIIRFDYKMLFFCSNIKPSLILQNGSKVIDEYSQPAWQKSRMWSQYAFAHQGLCLVYSKKAIEEMIISLDNNDYHKSDFVEYTVQNMYQEGAHFIDANKLLEETLKKYPLKHVQRRIKKLFFTKNIDYRDEAEYRVAIYDPDNKYSFINIGNCLKGVIIGHSASKIYDSIIMEYCKENEINSFYMDWSTGQGRVFPNSKPRKR